MCWFDSSRPQITLPIPFLFNLQLIDFVFGWGAEVMGEKEYIVGNHGDQLLGMSHGRFDPFYQVSGSIIFCIQTNKS